MAEMLLRGIVFLLTGEKALEIFGAFLLVCCAAGLVSGAIYNAILGHCPLKARAEIIYTWNNKDFLRLPPAIAGHVKNSDHP